MPDQFQSLVTAIVGDDRERAKQLLAQDTALVRACATKPRLESSIAHWLYVGASALQVAAAGHRVEMAKLLLEAGADCGAVGKHRHAQPLHYAADGYLEDPNWDAKQQVRMINLLLK